MTVSTRKVSEAGEEATVSLLELWRVLQEVEAGVLLQKDVHVGLEIIRLDEVVLQLLEGPETTLLSGHALQLGPVLQESRFRDLV